MKHDLGDEFHRSTKYERGKLPGHRLDWSTKPAVYKVYLDTPSISLPAPDIQGGQGLWDALRTRRSVRAYKEDAVTQADLSQMLWASQGITARIHDHELRTAPSAGALYPIETYLCINRVEGIDHGIYHYNIKEHSLELMNAGDFSKEVGKAALDQKIAERAAVVFIWSAVFQRSKWKYLQRAYRYVFLDAGHLVQNLALSAEALGLGSCQIAAIYDDEMNNLLGLDGIEESVIYLSSVGHPMRER